MKLNIADRLNLGTLLPEKGTLDKMLIAKSIKEQTELKLEEIEKYDIIFSDKGQVSWNNEKSKDFYINVDFSESELNLLKDQVLEFDKEKKINAFLIDICLKIKNFEYKENDTQNND